jgi:hypothetical protein
VLCQAGLVYLAGRQGDAWGVRARAGPVDDGGRCVYRMCAAQASATGPATDKIDPADRVKWVLRALHVHVSRLLATTCSLLHSFRSIRTSCLPKLALLSNFRAEIRNGTITDTHVDSRLLDLWQCPAALIQ